MDKDIFLTRAQLDDLNTMGYTSQLNSLLESMCPLMDDEGFRVVVEERPVNAPPHLIAEFEDCESFRKWMNERYALDQ